MDKMLKGSIALQYETSNNQLDIMVPLARQHFVERTVHGDFELQIHYFLVFLITMASYTYPIVQPGCGRAVQSRHSGQDAVVEQPPHYCLQ